MIHMIRIVKYPNGETIEYTPKKRVVRIRYLLRDLGYEPCEVVVVKGGKPVTEDDVVIDGDEIELYEVISTG